MKITTLKSGKYCVDSKGMPRKGWRIISGKLYYVSASGKIKTGTKYQGITFTKKGYASMFAVLAKELGYQPYIIQAWIPGEHCFVRINNKYYDNMGNRFGTAAQSHRVHKIWKV